jgi:hypothetical protein
MRGEAERNCFDLVKQHLKQEDFFGTTVEDDRLIRKIIDTSWENPKSSEFPDFIFDEGFVEHFQVTSSKVTRKGSTRCTEDAGIDRDYENRVQSVMEKTPKDAITIRTVETPQQWYKANSYEYFRDSFERSFEDHLDSLRKYKGEKKHSVFMIEYSDAALCMSKRLPKDLLLEVSYGDLLSREDPAYRLSRDIELLRYIYNQREQVEFVVFVDNNCFHGLKIDVIKSKNALEVAKLLHEGYDFTCAMVGSGRFGINLTIPDSMGEKEDE